MGVLPIEVSHDNVNFVTQVSEVTDNKDEAVTKAIQEAINQVNTHSESNAKRISKFAILPQDFSIPGGELGTSFPCVFAVLL